MDVSMKKKTNAVLLPFFPGANDYVDLTEMTGSVKNDAHGRLAQRESTAFTRQGS